MLSGEDSEDECKDNVLVIHGSCGVGKTSTVHACANQLGFQVSPQIYRYHLQVNMYVFIFFFLFHRRF